MRIEIIRSAAMAVVVVVLALTGCANTGTGGSSADQGREAGANATAPEDNPPGDIPDNQVYVPFVAPDNVFVISVPEGWSRSPNGAATVFTDKSNTVRVEILTAPTAPTVESVTSQELATIQFATPGYSPGSVSMVERASGPAVLITYQGTSAPSPVTDKTVTESVERYEFWRNGHTVILTLSGPVGADNVDPWRTITDSLQWT